MIVFSLPRLRYICLNDNILLCVVLEMENYNNKRGKKVADGTILLRANLGQINALGHCVHILRNQYFGIFTPLS